jgi:UDP-2,3-diacylglucosamine hydrolase
LRAVSEVPISTCDLHHPTAAGATRGLHTALSETPPPPPPAPPPSAPPLPSAAVVVADAHLGHSPDSVSDCSFNAFLETVPSLGDHLLINGDLFDFWFEYRAVIPRDAFGTLAALAALRKAGVRLTVTGGNHDRWGGSFWREQMDASFYRESVRVDLGGLPSFVHHGDGLAEQHRGGALMHRLTRNPLTAGAFRWIHPDLGFWLVRRMSRVLGQSTREGEVLERAAEAQAGLARALLAQHPDVRLVVLGHTHRAALEEVAEGKWYLNPGGWMNDRRYAVVTEEGPSLRVFE